MKRIYGFLFGALMLFVLVLACEDDISDALDSADVIDNVTVTVKGEVVDASTGEPVSKKISVNLSGEAKQIAALALGDADGKLEFDSGDGIVNLQLPSLSLDAVKDKDLRLIVAVDGYIGSSVQIDDLTEDFSFVLNLVNVDTPPSGVSVIKQAAGAIDASGALASKTTISTPTNAEITETAEITLPQGTVMKDADGNALSGQLEATVGYFSPKKQEALESFPGGLMVKTDNDSETGFFVSGGFVSIDITDENGKEAETFEGNNPGVSINIPSDLVNPETGQAVQAGENVPLWSYNKETGEWKGESRLLRNSGGIQSENGKLVLQFDIEHLSYYNVDWHNPGKLDKSRPIKIGKDDGVYKGRYILELKSADKGFYVRRYINYDEAFQLLNVPSFELNAKLYKRYYFNRRGNYYEIGSAGNVKLGDSSDLVLPVDIETPYIPEQQ